jgi:hypothetical protein
VIERMQYPTVRVALVEYLASALDMSPKSLVGDMPYEIAAVKRNGKVMGAVLYTNWRENSIEMSCAGEPGWLTRASIRDLFAYPFFQLDVETVLSLVSRHRKAARQFNKKLGFKELCVIPARKRRDDTFLYGMTRSQCAWITSKPRAEVSRHGQESTQSAQAY